MDVSFAAVSEEGFSAHEHAFLHGGPSSNFLVLKGDRLLVWVLAPADVDPESGLASVRRLLAALLRRRGVSGKVEAEENGGLTVDWPIRGRTVADALRLHEEMVALMVAAEGGEIPRPSVLDLLVGQSESDWLEAKGASYDHLGPNWGPLAGRSPAASRSFRQRISSF